MLPFAYAKRHGVLLRDQVLQVRRGASLAFVQEAQRFAGRLLPLSWLEPEVFEHELAQAYQRDSSEVRQMAEGLGAELDLASLAELTPESGDLLEQEDDAPIIRLINAILSEAIKAGASDIHLETFEKRLVVRFRVDGILREVIEPRRELAALLVSRIKVMARLDIAEKRVPQDGRISLKVGGREVDIRVSTLPSANGERVVLRLLDKQAGRLSLVHLGMSERDRQLLDENLRKPHGIILVTGPTGSGKTTTLYAGLTTLNDRSRNILTVEDPIEYYLEGIGQTQVNQRVDMTFARGLRAILRQDPDVVMVGEIRDQETADIAVQASLTGHLVAFYVAHQQRSGCRYPPGGHGRRALPVVFFATRCVGSAPGPRTLPALQGSVPGRRGRVRPARHRPSDSADIAPRQGMPGMPSARLSRSYRYLRVGDLRRPDTHAGAQRCG